MAKVLLDYGGWQTTIARGLTQITRMRPRKRLGTTIADFFAEKEKMPFVIESEVQRLTKRSELANWQRSRHFSEKS